MNNYRIHGDNIVECERTLSILCKSLNANAILLNSPAYKPVYMLQSNEITFEVELLSGHDRWGVSLGEQIMNNGGILRENADSYFSHILNGKEHILFAFEYCSALPAGNNAWQRNGRALSSIQASIPYFYFAELGGPELDADRNMKAPRYPNPVVPFSYISATSVYSYFCIPVYSAHPSITEANKREFDNIFGDVAFLGLVRKLILSENYKAELDLLVNKALALVQLLSSKRRGKNTFMGDQWAQLLKSKNPAQWIISNGNELTWRKKVAGKTATTDSFNLLFNKVLALNCHTIGSSDLPICLLDSYQKERFKDIILQIYPYLSVNFKTDKPLAVIWITGFKPRGDDSRPDRGLSPLAKMVLGNSCEYMAVVYGPAKPFTWATLKRNPKELASNNGLWQSIFNICDYVLADSVTSSNAFFVNANHSATSNGGELCFDYVPVSPNYGEHDIDTVIHQLLSHNEAHGIFECLCNPPGGDWSGINYHIGENVYRWTSLPRVSNSGAKRPDHVVQIDSSYNGSYFLSIESKGRANDLEDNIGINLKTYLEDLFECPPTSYKTPQTDWRFYGGQWSASTVDIYSVGAFIYDSYEGMVEQLTKGQLDGIIAIELGSTTIIHIVDSTKQRCLVSCIEAVANKISTIKIKIY